MCEPLAAFETMWIDRVGSLLTNTQAQNKGIFPQMSFVASHLLLLPAGIGDASELVRSRALRLPAVYMRLRRDWLLLAIDAGIRNKYR